MTDKCQHDLADRETACADGMCPLCLSAQIAALKDQLIKVRLSLGLSRHSEDNLLETIAKLRAQLTEALI